MKSLEERRHGFRLKLESYYKESEPIMKVITMIRSTALSMTATVSNGRINTFEPDYTPGQESILEDCELLLAQLQNQIFGDYDKELKK